MPIMSDDAVLTIDIPEIRLFKRGKVREVFNIGENLLLVATDRISAFDFIMPNGIPEKGAILTQISAFWFDFTKDIINNHLISASLPEFPAILQKHKVLAKRSMLVEKTDLLPVECVVRGYITGSGWKDYQKTGEICGIKLPANLRESEKLPSPIFTPTTKAEEGHDLPISFSEVVKLIGEEAAKQIRDKSIEIYKKCAEYALTKGIIIADTKFEFGKKKNGEIILIDEILTPDSSRFWPQDSYKVGQSQPSYDKQFVRDYLESINWNKLPPAPELPKEIVEKTRLKYLEAFMKLTGKKGL